MHLWQSAWSDWIRARTFGRPLSGQGYGIGVLASMPTADGGAMLASADEDGFVKCWRVPSSERPKSNWWPRPLAQPMTQGRDSLSSYGYGRKPGARITALLALEVSGCHLMLAGGRADGQMSFWDPMTAELLVEAVPGHAGPIHTIIQWEQSTRRSLLVTAADNDTTLQIWNPSTLARVSIVNVATPIRALCAISSDELAIGTDEGVAVIALSSIDA